jgi:hypothetical protein
MGASSVTGVGQGSAFPGNKLPALIYTINEVIDLNGGGGGSGTITSVNGDTGPAVVLTYGDIPGTPTLATVATTGAYSDLTGTPTIPGSTGFSQVIYVDKNTGNDTTGNGSLTLPYLTVGKAMSVIPTSGLSLTNSYAIQLGPGAYVEASLAIKPFVHICGMGHLASRISLTSNEITLDTSGGMFTGNSRVGFYNMGFSGNTGFNFNTSALSFASLVVDGRDCWVNGSSIFNGRAGGADYVQFFGFFFFGNVSLTRTQGILSDTFVAGSVDIICSSYGASGTTEYDLSGSQVGALTVTSDNSRTQLVGVSFSSIPSITGTGAGITITCDSTSIPNYTDITLSGGAAVAKNIPFPRKIAVPSLATSAGLVGDYAVDGSFHYDCIATNTWVRSAVATW